MLDVSFFSVKIITDLFIHLKGRVTERGRMEWDLPSSGLLLRCMQQPEMSHSKARSQDVPEFPTWVQRSKLSNHVPPPSQVDHWGTGLEVELLDCRPTQPLWLVTCLTVIWLECFCSYHLWDSVSLFFVFVADLVILLIIVSWTFWFSTYIHIYLEIYESCTATT